MPKINKLIADSLGLEPGDIIITEMPFEDSIASDFPAVGNLDKFEAGHIAIWTGISFTKPLAHAVSEGYKLPGVRLTNISDGRHVVFRCANTHMAQEIGIIARRWALAVSVFDVKRFDAVYPQRFWDTDASYTQHKKDFFSFPCATALGPATPYNFERASLQKFDRIRKPELKNFSQDSLRRAIKFSSRSELMQPVSKGLRCTSFVVSCIQAAALSPITKKTLVKASFKPYKDRPFDEYANKVLLTDWMELEQGKKLHQAIQTWDFTSFFPEGFAIDSKYSLPSDLFEGLRKSKKDWIYIGSFCSFEGKCLHLKSHFMTPKPSVSGVCETDCKESIPPLVLSEQRVEEATDLAQQIQQENQRAHRVQFFATPDKKKSSRPSDIPEFNGKKSAAERRLLF